MNNSDLVKKYPSNWPKWFCEEVKLKPREEQIKLILKYIKKK